MNFLISERAGTWLFDRNKIKEVTIVGQSWFGHLPLVEHVLSKLDGLEKVRWEIMEPVSEVIVKTLEEKENGVDFYYNFWTWKQSDDSNQEHDSSWTLANSSLLYKFDEELELWLV